MHHADAGLQCVKRRVEGDLLAVDKDIAFITAGLADHVHAEKDLHQGTLTGAVFAHETQHFALFQREVDVRQHLVSEEVLLDVAHLQQGSIVIFHNIPYLKVNRGEESLPPVLYVVLCKSYVS